MRAKNSLFLLILLALAMTYMSLSRIHKRKTLGIKEGRLFDIGRNGITSFEIERDKTKLTFRRGNGKWIIEHPLRDRADIHAVEGVLEKIEGLKWKSMLAPEEGKPLKKFGLDPPGITVSFTTGGNRNKLYIGEAAPMSSLVYAATGRMDAVYLISDSIMPRLANELDDFRDRAVIPFDITDVIKIDIKKSSGDLTLQKQNGAWLAMKPVAAPVQEQTVDSILVLLKLLNVKEFADDSPVTLEPYGLNDSEFIIMLTLSGGATTGMRIGRVDEQNKRCYVMRESDPYVFAVDSGQIDLLDKCIEYLVRILPSKPKQSNE